MSPGFRMVADGCRQQTSAERTARTITAGSVAVRCMPNSSFRISSTQFWLSFDTTLSSGVTK